MSLSVPPSYDLPHVATEPSDLSAHAALCVKNILDPVKSFVVGRPLLTSLFWNVPQHLSSPPVVTPAKALAGCVLAATCKLGNMFLSWLDEAEKIEENVSVGADAP